MGGTRLYIEAEFASGFIRREDKKDQSQFVKGKNVYWDIRNGLHVPQHGPIRRWSLIESPTDRIDVDFTILPPAALPYREMDVKGDFYPGGKIDKTILAMRFGWEILDAEGNRVGGEIVPVF